MLRSRIEIRIRICRIHMFLGLLDPDSDPIRGMDPGPDSFIIKQKWQEKPWFLLLRDFFLAFYFKKWCKYTFKK